MPTVTQLQGYIREHKRKNCRAFSKLKKAQLLALAKEFGYVEELKPKTGKTKKKAPAKKAPKQKVTKKTTPVVLLETSKLIESRKKPPAPLRQAPVISKKKHGTATAFKSATEMHVKNKSYNVMKLIYYILQFWNLSRPAVAKSGKGGEKNPEKPNDSTFDKLLELAKRKFKYIECDEDSMFSAEDAVGEMYAADAAVSEIGYSKSKSEPWTTYRSTY